MNNIETAIFLYFGIIGMAILATAIYVNDILVKVTLFNGAAMHFIALMFYYHVVRITNIRSNNGRKQS